MGGGGEDYKVGGGAERLIFGDCDPEVGDPGRSAGVGDPGTPQQLHRELTSAPGGADGRLGAQPRQNIHSSRPQAGQSMFTLFSPSVALHNQHGQDQMWRIVKSRRERACVLISITSWHGVSNLEEGLPVFP